MISFSPRESELGNAPARIHALVHWVNLDAAETESERCALSWECWRTCATTCTCSASQRPSAQAQSLPRHHCRLSAYQCSLLIAVKSVFCIKSSSAELVFFSRYVNHLTLEKCDYFLVRPRYQKLLL